MRRRGEQRWLKDDIAPRPEAPTSETMHVPCTRCGRLVMRVFRVSTPGEAVTDMQCEDVLGPLVLFSRDNPSPVPRLFCVRCSGHLERWLNMEN